MKTYFFLVIVFFYIKITLSQNIVFKEFIGKPIKTNYIKEIENQFFYIYKDNSYTQASLDSEVSSLIGFIDVKGEVLPIFRYIFTINNRNYTVLKYQLILDKNDTRIESSFYSFNSGNWNKIDTISNNRLMKIYNTLKSISLEFFINISRDSDDLKYPEINKLKPLVKDANGVLNIEKLAKVIEENKSSLAKYLD